RVTDGKIYDETIQVLGGRDSIRCLLATDDGSLWIGFATDGLGRLKNGKFSRIRAAQGLDDDSISQIASDDFGWFWFGADHGIFKIRQAELDDMADGKISHVQSIHYGHDEGLQSLQAEGGFTPGALSARDGHIWIPLRSALACIDPTRLPDNLDPPLVLLKRIAMDDKTIGMYGGVMPVANVLNLQSPVAAHLPAGHHRLEFEFTALNFTTPENMQFRYRLDGVDDDWIDGKNQRDVSYPGLASGHYHFQVTARKSGGMWNPKPAVFEFSIHPFIWETWWFKCILLIIFTAAVIAIGRYVSFRRLRRKLEILEQQAALERERARIAKDIHDDLGGSLTHTALLLNLASQDRNAPEKIGAHLQQATTTVRQVTESIDEIVWAANPRNDTLADLNDYISLFAVQFLQAADIRCR
ncbi:MAG TPA: triple tyrosine motif-containing protein, partial [Candidatus Baltobacteraceae bacterium]|nr:triple tyrosine motif-containing protein [Candidatus Baltobacteraceae bacterium]